MSDIIDRVAKAIASVIWAEDYPGTDASQRAKIQEAARAAIEAMREPNDEMRRAGLYRGPLLTDRVENPDAPWVRMIDEALK